MNRERAPSGPVKVVVTNRPHSRRHNGIELVSGVSAVLAWFLQVGLAKLHLVLSVRKAAPYKCHRKLLLSVLTVRSKACKEMLLTKYCKQSNSRTRMPWLNLELDEEFQASNCFTELIRGTRWEWLSLTPCWGSSLLEPRG